MRIQGLLFSLALVGEIAAQGSGVVPGRATSRDAPSLGTIAGFCARQRQQVLVHDRLLVGLRGRTLRELWFRRDASWPHALAAARSRIRIRLSVTGRDPDRPDPVFARNHGARIVEVFRGIAALPSSPALKGRTAPWTRANTIRLVFATGFVYPAGHLCLDIEGEPSTGGPCFWPVDFEESGRPGTARDVSRACGPLAGPGGVTFGAAGATFRVGNHARLHAWGAQGAVAWLMLSGRRLSPPIDLGPLGAPGCTVHVLPDVVLPRPFIPSGSGDGLTGWTLSLPLDRRLLAGVFFAQVLGLEGGLPRKRWSNPLAVTASNALEITISPSVPTLAMATVTSDRVLPGAPFPARGEVDVDTAPVLRFVYR